MQNIAKERSIWAVSLSRSKGSPLRSQSATYGVRERDPSLRLRLTGEVVLQVEETLGLNTFGKGRFHGGV